MASNGQRKGKFYIDTRVMIIQSYQQAHRSEDELSSKTKRELYDKIGSLRSKVLSRIATNKELPEVERLDSQEFILDTEKHQSMVVEEERQIEGVRQEIELSILATQYLREKLKQECWDRMTVKGNTVKVSCPPLFCYH